MSEVVLLTQFARKLNLTFRMIVPPSIAGNIVIKIGIFIPIPTLTIVFTLFLIPSGLLVTLLVRRLYQKHTHCLGGLRQSHGLSRSKLVDRQLNHLLHNRIRRFGTRTTNNAISMWSRFNLRVETRKRIIRNDLI